MKVFVTGSTGFVGSGVCRALLKDNHEVIGLTSQQNKAVLLEERGIQPVVGDMRDKNIISPQAEEADVTIMCAQLNFGSRFTKSKLKEFAEAEISGMNAVIDGAKKGKKRIIYTAGYIIFGNNSEGWSDESCGFDPPEFSRGGTEASRILLDETKKGTVNGCVIASGFIYGPSGFFADIVTQIKNGKMGLPGGGNYFWSPVYLEDLAQAYIKALSGGGDGNAIIIVDDEPMPMKEIMFSISDELKVKRPKSVPKFMASLFMGSAMVEGMTTSKRSKNKLAKEILGWQPSYSTFRQGIPSVLKELSK